MVRKEESLEVSLHCGAHGEGLYEWQTGIVLGLTRGDPTQYTSIFGVATHLRKLPRHQFGKQVTINPNKHIRMELVLLVNQFGGILSGSNEECQTRMF